jgi:glutamyl/glutaminyl-tRNA synthetase
MRVGEFAEGECVLRAKIDMASGNINLRDPVIYRIKKVVHHQTGNKWLIYPMYDYTHPISDAIENITHSLCTLEFEDHRPFYDWLLDTVKTPAHPQQIEFSRLNLNYTVTSKRKLKKLVDEGVVQVGMTRVCQRLQVYVVVVIPQSHCAIFVSVLVLAKVMAWLTLAYLNFVFVIISKTPLLVRWRY